MLGFASDQLAGLFGSGNHFWSTSPSIQIPFLSGNVINNLALAKANKKIAVSQYEKSVQTAFREVADALAGEATYARQLDALRLCRIQIGRASCRERVCQYVSISVVAG